MKRASREWESYWAHTVRTVESERQVLPKQPHFTKVLSCLSRHPQGSRVLEAGCGLGKWCFYLAEMGYQVCGVDISEVAVRECFKYQREERLSSHFIVGDVTSLPFRSSCFEVVLSFGVIEHFPNIVEAIQEHWRVLRSGGSCFVMVPSKFSLHALLYHRLIALSHSGLGFGGEEHYYTPRDIRNIMLRAGFSDVVCGIIPTHFLFGDFSFIPVLGNLIMRVLGTLSYSLEKRQSVIGVTSYAIGVK